MKQKEPASLVRLSPQPGKAAIQTCRGDSMHGIVVNKEGICVAVEWTEQAKREHEPLFTSADRVLCRREASWLNSVLPDESLSARLVSPHTGREVFLEPASPDLAGAIP